MSVGFPSNSIRRRQFEQLRKQLRQARAEMRRCLADRDRQIAELSRKVSEQERTLAELNRRIVEYDQRFDDIIAEVARVRMTEDVRVKKQKCITSKDKPTVSSASEIPALKPSSSVSEPSSSLELKPLPDISSDVGDGCLLSAANCKKRKAPSPLPHQLKHSRKADSSSVLEDVPRLRSSCRVFTK